MTPTPTDTPPEAAALDLEKLLREAGTVLMYNDPDLGGRLLDAARQHAGPQGSRAGDAPDAELREALEPFARAWNSDLEGEPDGHGIGSRGLRVGDLRRAHAALASTKRKEG